jgi:hypothetical protein
MKTVKLPGEELRIITSTNTLLIMISLSRKNKKSFVAFADKSSHHMSRRIFLQSDSFADASNIFTRVIWKKEIQAKYRNSGILTGENTRLFYGLSIYHSAIKNPEKATGSERSLVVTIEMTEAADVSKIISRSALNYKIITSVVIKKEKILEEEINVYLVTAKLVSREEEINLPSGMSPELTFTIKPELSATLGTQNEIYLPFCETYTTDEDF